MQKIMFFLPNLNGGGAERVIVNMLRQVDHQIFDISLVLVNETGVYQSLVPKYISVYNLGIKKTIFSPLRLRKIIKQIQPDIIFSTLFRTHIALYFALIGRKKPLIILRSPNSPKLLLKKGELSLIMMFFLKKVYLWADVVMAQTPEMKEEIMKYHHISESKIEVFVNPVDTKLINEKIKHISNPFDCRMINVVAAGRLTKQKGFDILIQSFQYVVQKNNKFVLHIIGNDDGEKDRLQTMVNDMNLNKNIKFLGFQDNPYKFFFFSDLYVLSSLWEGLPNTVLENMYLNKPIVATKCIPFMSTLIEHEKNGFLVDVANSNQLASAILSYKHIATGKSLFLRNNSDINKFLANIYGKNN